MKPLIHNPPSRFFLGSVSFFLVFMLVFCGGTPAGDTGDTRDYNTVDTDYTKKKRAEMVALLRLYKITDKKVLAAMAKVRRHLYIPPAHRDGENAYGDYPGSIGYGQTISQPFIVAYMTERMNIKRGDTVLEIGTGSGYQAAILAELGATVYSIEIVEELALHARDILKSEGYENVKVLRGDGYKGWPEFAPYDAIIVTCAPENIPPELTKQLKEGGRMILPVGKWHQRLVFLKKSNGKIIKVNDLNVRFVPMVHERYN